MADLRFYVVVFTLHVVGAKIYEKCELARELVYKYDFKKVNEPHVIFNYNYFCFSLENIWSKY
jgi:hypothetical protein